MIITNILVIKKLSEYRSLVEAWQQAMKETHGFSIGYQDDQLLLCHALDSGIEHMRDLLQIDRKEASA